MSKLPLIERLPSDVVESDDWLSNAFSIVEEDNGALSPFDLADIFPQPVETIPNTNSNNLIALASPQTTTKTSLGKHALASAEVAAVTTIAETTATATKKMVLYTSLSPECAVLIHGILVSISNSDSSHQL